MSDNVDSGGMPRIAVFHRGLHWYVLGLTRLSVQRVNLGLLVSNEATTRALMMIHTQVAQYMWPGTIMLREIAASMIIVCVPFRIMPYT